MKKINLVLFGIILLAVILRFYQLGINPPSLDWDEASIGYNAYSLLRTGKDEYGNSWPFSIRSFNDYKPPLYTYLTIPTVALFGLTEFAVRLPSAIAGIVAVAVMYFITKELFGKEKSKFDYSKTFTIPPISAFLLCISPWHLQFSRVAFEANVALTCFMIGVLYLMKAMRKSQSTWYVLSSLFFVLTMYTYHSSRLIVPVFLIIIFSLYFKNFKKHRKEIIPAAALGFILLVPMFITMSRGYAQARFSTVNVFENPGLYSKEAGYFGRQQEYAKVDSSTGSIFSLFHNHWLIKSLVITKNYFDHANFKFLFLTSDDVNRHGVVGMGLLYIWEAITMPIGMYVLSKEKRKKSIIIFIWMLVSPLAAALTTQTPHAVRSLLMLPPLIVFSSIGLMVITNKLNTLLKVIPVVVIAVTFFAYLDLYYIHTPVERSYSWLYGYKQVIEKMNEIEPEVNEVIFTTNYDQPYIYVLFYNKVDPSWYQQVAEEGSKGFGKYSFRPIEIKEDIKIPNRLIIANPKEMYEDIKSLDIIPFLDGSPAYHLIKT